MEEVPEGWKERWTGLKKAGALMVLQAASCEINIIKKKK